MELAHRREQRGRLEEAALRLGFGFACLLEPTQDAGADLERRRTALVARLLVALDALVEDLGHRGQRPLGLQHRFRPLVPPALEPGEDTLERALEPRPSATRLLELVPQAEDLAHQLPDTLLEHGEFAPAGALESARSGDLLAPDGPLEIPQSSHDAAVEPQRHRDPGEHPEPRDHPREHHREHGLERRIGSGEGRRDPRGSERGDQGACHAADPDADTEPGRRRRT